MQVCVCMCTHVYAKAAIQFTTTRFGSLTLANAEHQCGIYLESDECVGIRICVGGNTYICVRARV